MEFSAAQVKEALNAVVDQSVMKQVNLLALDMYSVAAAKAGSGHVEADVSVGAPNVPGGVGGRGRG
jgi:uncharacterized ferredoxin-like protein